MMGKWNWFTKEDAEELADEMIKAQTLENDFDDYELKFKKDEDESIGTNIYALDGEDGSVKEFGEKATFIHKVLKNSFLDAILIKFMKKYDSKLVDKLPDKSQFDKLNRFDRAYRKTVEDWAYKYLSMQDGKIMSKADCDASHAYWMKDRIGFMRKAYLSICSQDSAYMEFHNMLMLNLKVELDGMSMDHLLFTSKNVNDPRYFIIVHNPETWTSEMQRLAKGLVDNHLRVAEIVNDDGVVSYKVWDKRMPDFVKNTDLPKEG